MEIQAARNSFVIKYNNTFDDTDTTWTENQVKCLDCFSLLSTVNTEAEDGIDIFCKKDYCKRYHYHLTTDRIKRNALKRRNSDMPVVFLPSESDSYESEDCDDSSDTQMSSFGFMSFAMALVNAVINNANNVNNNNNNNNNNDNNNNNNIGNINIANSNNGVNNMNMVTAGRRRMLSENLRANFGNISSSKEVNKTSEFLHSLKKMRENQTSLDLYKHRFRKLQENDKVRASIKTISISYLNFKDTSTKYTTNGILFRQSVSPMTWVMAGLKKMYDSLFQKYADSVASIKSLIEKAPFKYYLDTFNLLP